MLSYCEEQPRTIMCIAVISASLALLTYTYASTIGLHSTGEGFCYSDADGCGPNTAAWSPLCHTGRSQSPITLPPAPLLGGTPLKYSVYRGSYFRMQNNGHSVQIDFDNQAPSNEILTFPDPLKIIGPNSNAHGPRQYRFASAHFHWGVSDYTTGSEHCIGIRCSAMELHLVHYLATYPTMADAVASGDTNALTVIGVLIDVHPMKPIDTDVLKPIVDNLYLISTAANDTTVYTTVYSPLDLSKFLYQAGAFVFTYKGSLTTPGCNEQVNWFVLRDPATTSHEDLEVFRTILKDERNITLKENHRPLQALNGRKVLLSNVLPN